MTSLSNRDLAHIWHPCTQMKDHESFPLLEIISASGCYLELSGGRKILDAVSSWWCKQLGHQHPRIKQAVYKQIEKFEHVILAGTTNETIVKLSEQLATLMPPLNKIMYASDGSSAVEIALKMSLYAQQLKGEHQRKKFISLQNSYHGETIGAMSVSDLGLYRSPYESMLFPVEFISAPYVHGCADRLWEDCELHWRRIEKQLAAAADTTAAIIVEPIVQGAGGMLIYSRDFLYRLRQWSQAHGIYLIADEIMTGIGRTGKMLACEHANIIPDFICLSKGLTSGWLPLSVTITNQQIYDLFYDDYETGKAFLHSHTYSGNALAASAACEVLTIMQEEKFAERAATIERHMHAALNEIAETTGLLINVRSLGAIAAADIDAKQHQRAGLSVHRTGLQYDVLLRPLGNSLYWLPPLIITDDELAELAHCTKRALISALK